MLETPQPPPDNLLVLYIPDAIYSLAGLPEPLPSPAAIQGAAADFLAGVPDLQMSIEALIGEADQVAVRYIARLRDRLASVCF
jgi:hypothetical protein